VIASPDTVTRPDFTPIGDRIRVRKCTACDVYLDDEGRKIYAMGDIAVPDTTGEITHWAEIIAVGPGCKIFTQEHIGAMVNCPETDNDLKCTDPDRWEYVITERALNARNTAIYYG
jgi:co-chaperonin GroES (HSP10)